MASCCCDIYIYIHRSHTYDCIIYLQLCICIYIFKYVQHIIYKQTHEILPHVCIYIHRGTSPNMCIYIYSIYIYICIYYIYVYIIYICIYCETSSFPPLHNCLHISSWVNNKSVFQDIRLSEGTRLRKAFWQRGGWAP